jgi:hypothetical protein
MTCSITTGLSEMRHADSDSVNLGSNPSPPATEILEKSGDLGAGQVGQDSPEAPDGRTESGTLAHLIAAYRTDKDSDYHRIRYATRQNYDRALARLIREHGAAKLADTTLRDVLRWHEAWSAGRKVAMGHQMVVMLRTVIGFGASLLEDPDCARLKGTLQRRFEMPKPRTVHLTSIQAQAIIDRAHFVGMHSIGMAQAFQFEFMLRQRDVIGEWVPDTEPGESYVQRIDKRHGHQKWLRGIRWEEIDDNLILRHITSKRLKLIEVDLKLAPLVMFELQRLGERPTTGPVIRWEVTGRPYDPPAFRREWRMIADKVGVPREIKNMDSRAGAITEATEAGADLEHIRQAATHSDIQTTLRYARAAAKKTANVNAARAEFRRDGTPTSRDFVILPRDPQSSADQAR